MKAKRFFLRSLQFFLSSVFAWSELDAAPFTVATYNVENYTLTNRFVDGAFRPDYPKPEADKAALRTIIRSLDADVLVLEEMGSPGFLEELQRDLVTEGVIYTQSHCFEADDPDRRLAVLAKRPWTSLREHRDLAFDYFGKTIRVKRGLLEVRFSTERGEIAIFAVHLKSRFTERPEDPEGGRQRVAEAEAVRNRILTIFPEPASQPFLIVGDFNDTRISRPVRALLNRGEISITHWLPAIDDRGEAWTYHYAHDDTYSRVDHLLASPAAANWVVHTWIAGGVGVASDHRPVVVTLDPERSSDE